MMIKLLLSVGVFFGISTIAKADITIGYPSPSQINIYQYAFLDINVDGINDFFVMVQKPANEVFVTIKGINGSQIETDGNYKAMALSPSAPVGNNSWQDSAVIYGTDLSFYYFSQATNRFAGLRVFKNGNYYNSYFELAVSGNNASFTCFLIKHGCETTAGLPILANSTSSSTGLSENTEELNFSIEGNILKLDVQISASYKLIDLSGRVIWSEFLTQGKHEIACLERQGFCILTSQQYNGERTRSKNIWIP